MKKVIVTIVIALFLCLNLNTINVNAATCPPHVGPFQSYSGPVSGWTTSHNEPTGYYVDGKPITYVCTVTHTIVKHDLYCRNCSTVINTEYEELMTHSKCGR